MTLSVITINKKEYPFHLGLGVFIQLEKKYDKPFQELIQSNQLRYLIEILFRGIQNAEKKERVKHFSFQSVEDLADELTSDMSVITDQLPKIMEGLFPEATDSEKNEPSLN